MLLVGLRYGVSSIKYDVDALGVDDPIYGGIVGNPNLDDEIWGGSLPYSHKGMKGSMQWAEFLCRYPGARLEGIVYGLVATLQVQIVRLRR